MVVYGGQCACFIFVLCYIFCKFFSSVYIRVVNREILKFKVLKFKKSFEKYKTFRSRYLDPGKSVFQSFLKFLTVVELWTNN